MSLGAWLRGRGRRTGPSGVNISVRSHNRAAVQKRRAAHSLPALLKWGLVLASVFYLLAHYSVVAGVWPVHGTSAGAGGMLMRDLASLLAWLLLFPVLRALGYRGNWAVVVLPVLIFLVTRPALFQLFTDPVYQAPAGMRAEANALKAERSQLTTILRAYDPERQTVVFDGPPPEIPEGLETARATSGSEGFDVSRWVSLSTVFLAPLVLLLGFLWTRRSERLLRFRERRAWPFGLVLAVFFMIALLPEARSTGKLAGTTPWELFLPIFVGVWAAVLADDAYNLSRPGAVVSRRRVAGLLLYGALPVLPFLIIHDLGLSVILAGSLATMLLVGTRRGWWAGLLLGIWALLVLAAFQLDQRSRTRLALALEPYRDVSTLSEPAAEAWAAKVHQIKLFDANVLAGGWFGAGPGRGHAETAPNAADDGYITTIAAQWGWLGSLSLVLLYTAFLVQMLAVAAREHSAFERSLVTGLTMLIGIPFWLATLGGIRVVPLTGVAAAFAAHGGAKLLASALAVGVIAGVSHRRAELERLQAADRSADDPLESGVRVR